MIASKLAMLVGTSALLHFSVSTCRSSESGSGQSPSAEAPAVVKLEGVDTSALTNRENRQWSAHVSELLAPCKDQPVSLAECVLGKRACKSCLPAAKYLVKKVQQGLTEGQVETAYRNRFSPDAVKEIDLSGSPTMGADTANVTIVEWADFECPACRAASPLIEDVVKGSAGSVRLVFKHFPLALHEHAEKAARAAVAADRQGKFWQMHHALFETEPPLSVPTLTKLAKNIGLDVEQFKKDLESEAVADIVARDKKQGEEVDLTGTPTIYINGRHFVSPGDMKTDLEEWISLELELGGRARPTASKPGPAGTASGTSAPPASVQAKDQPAAAPAASSE